MRQREVHCAVRSSACFTSFLNAARGLVISLGMWLTSSFRIIACRRMIESTAEDIALEHVGHLALGDVVLALQEAERAQLVDEARELVAELQEQAVRDVRLDAHPRHHHVDGEVRLVADRGHPHVVRKFARLALLWRLDGAGRRLGSRRVPRELADAAAEAAGLCPLPLRARRRGGALGGALGVLVIRRAVGCLVVALGGLLDLVREARAARCGRLPRPRRRPVVADAGARCAVVNVTMVARELDHRGRLGRAAFVARLEVAVSQHRPSKLAAAPIWARRRRKRPLGRRHSGERGGRVAYAGLPISALCSFGTPSVSQGEVK